MVVNLIIRCEADSLPIPVVHPPLAGELEVREAKRGGAIWSDCWWSWPVVPEIPIRAFGEITVFARLTYPQSMFEIGFLKSANGFLIDPQHAFTFCSFNLFLQ